MQYHVKKCIYTFRLWYQYRVKKSMLIYVYIFKLCHTVITENSGSASIENRDWNEFQSDIWIFKKECSNIFEYSSYNWVWSIIQNFGFLKRGTVVQFF